MTEEVLFPDAVDVAIAAVDPAVAVPVSGRVPTDRPAAFIRIRRVGGTRQNKVMDGAHLVIESWANVDTVALDNLQLARQALTAASGETIAGTVVGLVTELSGPGDLPDPASDQPRVTQTFVFPCRGT